MAQEEIELQAPRSNFLKTTRPEEHGSPNISDERQLLRLGKKPLLNRTFGFMSILGFSCSALVSWEGILFSSVGGFYNGGPAGIIWGLLINWIGALSTFTAIAELASIAPTTGGQYHWVAMIAPESCKNFLSYLTAWLTIAAWQSIACSTGYAIGTLIQGMVALAHPAYIPKSYHTMLLMWAIMALAVGINSTTGRLLAKLEGIVLIFHLVGFFLILVPLVYFAPHSDPSLVFTTFMNLGGWSSQTLSFMVGLPISAYCFISADCAVHLSEEIQSAATVVPQAIIWTVSLNGMLAFAIGVAMLFCVGDLEAALESQQTFFYPIIEIFRQAVKSMAGTQLMITVLVVMGVASAVSTYACASRMLWAFSRDQGLPFSHHLTKLSKNTLPVFAIAATLLISTILSLIVLGSTITFSAFTSLGVAGFYFPYFIVCTLLLWRRLTGALKPHDPYPMYDDNLPLTWGPWRIREPWGTANNTFACSYLLFLIVWIFWPQTTPTTPQTANWAILVFGSVVLFCTGWYVFRAKSYFKGPIREVESEQAYE